MPPLDQTEAWDLRFELSDRRAGAIGPPIVFLHGLAGSGRYWGELVQPLASQFRLFIPDLLGFGRSPWPRMNYTVDIHVAAIRRYVEHAGLAQEYLTLVGHSPGGILAIEYAARYQAKGLLAFNLPCYASADEARRIIRQEGGLHALTVSNRSVAHFL